MKCFSLCVFPFLPISRRFSDCVTPPRVSGIPEEARESLHPPWMGVRTEWELDTTEPGRKIKEFSGIKEFITGLEKSHKGQPKV